MSDFHNGRLAGEDLPLRKGYGASFSEGLTIDDVTFEIEVIVDVGVDRGELL